MRTTVLTHDEIELLVKGNRRLRLRADDSRWLLRRGAKYLVVSGELNEDRLYQYLETAIREEYDLTTADVTVFEKIQSTIVISILLNIILPVVIKLIIEWWKNRNTDV